jgi:peptidyl-prolyl cis-trans isomerase D
MLQNIRDRAQGWIAWVIVILISIPFALWGIQSYLEVGAEPVVATVNGMEITRRDLDQRVQRTRMQLREQLGAAYDAGDIDEKTLRREVLDGMVREALLVDASNRLGMRVSDQELRAEILSEPAFQRDGVFDNATYEQALRIQGLSPAQFEAQLRQRMVGGQFARGLAASELVTSAEGDAFQRLTGQRRELAWIRIPSARFLGDEPVSDADIQAYYGANPDEFRVPERVKLEYLILDVSRLAEGEEIGEEALRAAYESEQARFGQPERRKIRHILRTLPTGADDAAAESTLQELTAIRERILGGATFDEVAREVSQDPGSASQGGSLGEIERGLMDPSFDEIAFSLQAGAVSDPVKTRFGYHLILVDEIVPASVKPFDEVRESLAAELARQRAESLFYDQAERLANVVYETADSLEPAAEELGLTIETSDWIERDGDGAEGILSEPKVQAAAFSEDVLVERRNSDLIEPVKDELRAVVFRVIDHQDATVKPLDAVRDGIVASIRQDRAETAAMEAAEAAAEALREGAELAAVAGGDPLTEAGLVERNAPNLPAAVVDLGFTLPAPAEGLASVGTTALEDGDAAVVRVAKVEPGEVSAVEGGAPDPIRSMLTQLMGRQVAEAVLDDMARRADIEREPLGGDDEG